MGINFACRKIEVDDIIRCSFGINKSEHSVLLFLLKENRAMKINEISELLNKERTTVQKIIKNLIKKGLLSRRQINLSKGGYVFVYHAIDKQKIKDYIKNNIKEWISGAEKEIEFW